MCGIYGFTGQTSTMEIVRKLQCLEYRGYDSCGIAYFFKGHAFINKTIGNTSKLKCIVDNRQITAAIGHTRWATHGAVTPINAHPHTSSLQRFYVVHNGVIENYQDIIKRYQFKMKSSTDTEVVVHLLDLFMSQFEPLQALRELINTLEGSFALVVLDKKTPNRIYFCKNKSPLLISNSPNGIEIASDQSVFEKGARVTILNDFDYGYVEDFNIVLHSLSDMKREEFVKANDAIFSKSSKHYMLDEILYQESMVELLKKNYSMIITENFLKDIQEAEELLFIGAGSAYYACCILKDYYEKKYKKRCFAIVASEIDTHLILSKKIIVICLSQSGETADLLKAVGYLKERNIKIVSLCNNTHSTLCYKSDAIFPLFAGPEIAVASTKVFLSMILVGKLLINKKEIMNLAITNYIHNSIEQTEQVLQIAQTLSTMKRVFFLAKKDAYLLALEAALKLREVSYLDAFAFYSGELKHGSIALVDQQTCCIAFLTNPEDERFIYSNLEEAASRGAKTYMLSSVGSSDAIQMSDGEYSFIVFSQLLAYYTALLLHRNIDQPRNLAKSVTVY